MQMEQIFTDIHGRKLRLTKERFEHIETNHPELKESVELIKITVETPEYIVQSSSDARVELYYHYFYSTPVGDKLLCVVAKNLDTDFFIITVYFTDKIKKGEIIWKKM